MTTKHTAGPWHRNIRCAGKYPVVFAGRNQYVATVSQQEHGDETEANIDLIMSAPELLEALKPFASLAIETCSKCEGDGKHGVTDMACHQCGGIGEIVTGFPNPHDVRAAKAAIAKALGK